MPKRQVVIRHANHSTFILEGTIGTDYRFSVPKQLRANIPPNAKVEITIKLLKE